MCGSCFMLVSEEYCIALIEKEYKVGCRWQSQATSFSLGMLGVRHRHTSETGLPGTAQDASPPSAWLE